MYGKTMFEQQENPVKQSCGKCEQCSCDSKATRVEYKLIDQQNAPSVQYKFLDIQEQHN